MVLQDFYSPKVKTLGPSPRKLLDIGQNRADDHYLLRHAILHNPRQSNDVLDQKQGILHLQMQARVEGDLREEKKCTQ